MTSRACLIELGVSERWDFTRQALHAGPDLGDFISGDGGSAADYSVRAPNWKVCRHLFQRRAAALFEL